MYNLQAMNIRSELAVVSLSVHADPNLWEERMRVVIKLYSQALLTGKSHVIEAVVLSCLGIIKSQIVIDSKPLSSKHRVNLSSQPPLYIVFTTSSDLKRW